MTDKADVNNNEQTITAGTINATNINKNGVAVATVNDIPSVPDISGKADLNNSSQTIVAGTVKATNITKGNVNVATVNDIPDISGKVNIAQGTDNAGKVLGINASGNVEPTTVSGGEVWEEIDLSNIPTDFTAGDRVKIEFKVHVAPNYPNNWSSTISNPTFVLDDASKSEIMEYGLYSDNQYYCNSIIALRVLGAAISFVLVERISSLSFFGKSDIGLITPVIFNGNSCVKGTSVTIDRNNAKNYISRMWRLKK